MTLESDSSDEDQEFLRNLERCERLALENWALGKQDTGLFQEASFMSALHETHKWDEGAYWQFDKAVVEIAEKYKGRILPRLLLRALVDLFIELNDKLAYHRMPSDLWQIDNFSDQECHEWSERVTAIFQAAMTGDTFQNDGWERVNPLLV